MKTASIAIVACRNFYINEWSTPALCGNGQSIPDARSEHSAAVYSRGPSNDPNPDNSSRMLVFGGINSKSEIIGDTWLYYPMINSWIRPQLQIFEPSPRVQHSMTTLCETRVVLFGGSLTNNLPRKNDTWMFDGVTETWSPIKLSSESHTISRQFQYFGVPVRQPNNSCSCKESVFVYGVDEGGSTSGVTIRTGMWEFRCVDDSMASMTFEWIPLGNGTGGPDSGYFRSVFAFGGYSVFFWINNFVGSSGLNLWLFDIRSKHWTLITFDTHFKNSQGKFDDDFYVALPFRFDHQNVVLILNNFPYLLNLSAGEITDLSVHLLTPIAVTELMDFSAVAMDGSVLVYGGTSDFGGLSNIVWNLTVSRNRVAWTMNNHPDTRPSARVIAQSNGAVVGNSFYLFGGIQDTMGRGFPSLPNNVWQLMVTSGVWIHNFNSFAPSPRMLGATAVVHDSLIILFGGVVQVVGSSVIFPFFFPNSVNDTWVYFTIARRWVQYVSSTAPAARVSATLTAMSNGSVLLFGGIDATLSGHLLNDLWLLDICQTTFSSAIQHCNGWRLIGHYGTALDTWPSPMYGHSATAVEDSMVITGGKTEQNLHSVSSLDIWLYNITTRKWARHRPKSSPTPPSWYGGVSAVAIGWKLIVVKQDVSLLSYLSGYGPNDANDFDDYLGRRVTLVYSVRQQKWLKQAEGPNFGVGMILRFEDKVMILGRTAYSKAELNPENLLSVMTPLCEKGYFSSSWSSNDCAPCNKGYFAKIASHNCSKCPSGRTTREPAAATVSDCVCETSYCAHGSCQVESKNAYIEPVCHCHFGYSGPRCQNDYLKYVFIGSTLALIGVIILTTFSILKCINYKKGQMEAEEELYTMKKVWSIGNQEISLQDHVGAGGSANVRKLVTEK